LNAEKQLMNRGVFFINVVDISGSHYGDVQLVRKREQAFVDLVKFGDGVSLDFQIVILEDFPIPARCRSSIFKATL